MLQVQDLTTSYGPVKALDGVSFEAPRGKITAVLGANGAGKTTLLRTVSGLIRPARGAAYLEGADLTRTPAEAMPGLGLSHVPEGRGVITELTVEENLRLGGLAGPTAPGPPTSSGCTRCSRCSATGAAPSRTCSPAASGRCSSSAGR